MENTLVNKPRHEMLTRKEAAAYLGTTEGTLAVWASTKRYGLPMVKIGSLARYRKQDLDEFIAKQTVIQSGGQGAK